MSQIARPLPSPSPAWTVDELVARARDGEPEAITQLFLDHGPAAEATARRQLSSDADVDDAVAEAFARTLERLPSLRDPTRFGAYLCSCVRNLAHDRQRGRARTMAQQHGAEPPGSNRAVEDVIADADERARLCWAVAELPPRQRYALWRFYWEDARVDAVATELGLTANATTQLLFRARATLGSSPRLGRGAWRRRGGAQPT